MKNNPEEDLLTAVITIIGSGMIGSAPAFPARENGNEVRLVGSPLDHEIIEVCQNTNRHPKPEKNPVNIPWEAFTLDA